MDTRLIYHGIRLSRRALLSSACLAATLVANASFANCFEQAAAYHQVNSLVLRAIAWQESRARPNATHVNKNGSIDYGMMQINSIHLRELSRYGLSSDKLMQSCTSVYVAAWHLRKMMNKYGNSWTAIGAYHSETPGERDNYARSISRLLAQTSAKEGIHSRKFAPPSGDSPQVQLTQANQN